MNGNRLSRVLGVCAVVVLSSACTYTARMSVDSDGVQGNGDVGTTNGVPAISGDGRYVAFESRATKLVHGDTNNRPDIFLRDPVARTTRRVNVSSAGAQALGGDSHRPAISANGRYVAYLSSAPNLTGDTSGTWHAFRYNTSTGTTARVDVSTTGQPSVDGGYTPAISGDGRYVAFTSPFTGWATGDTGFDDVFVRDMNAGTISKVSVSTTGSMYTSGFSPSMSADGRYIAFNSVDTIVPGDTNGVFDVFVRDRTMNTTVRVSLTISGQQQNGGSNNPQISADGHFVVFQSLATNLVLHDNNGRRDVFVRNWMAGTTTRVNVSSSGVEANGDAECYDTSISSDGRYVAFDSNATTLVASDTNQSPDVFVRDLLRHTTTRVSVDQFGGQSTGGFSGCPVISANGRYVAFLSVANNLVANDTNGRWDVFVRSNPVPTVATAPRTVGRGTTTTVSVRGTYFLPGVVGVAPNGITINSVARVDETHVNVSITIAPNASTGNQQFGLYNPGTGQGPLSGSIVGVPLTIT